MNRIKQLPELLDIPSGKAKDKRTMNIANLS